MSHVQPLSDAQAHGEAKALFDAVQHQMHLVPNIFRAMGHAPAVLKSTLGLNAAIGHGLDPKLRELAYLKAANVLHCGYCNHYHQMSGKSAGLSAAQLQEVANFESSVAYDDVQKDVLRFADQWTNKGTVEPAVMSRLKEKLSPSEFITLAATVGLANWTCRFNVVFDMELP